MSFSASPGATINAPMELRARNCRPTQCAADKWESPRFLRDFNISAGFRF